MAKPPAIPLEKITALKHVYTLTIPPEYEDYNGHMNIRWYMVIFDDAGLPLYDDLGLTPEYLKANGVGGFDLEHHIHYLNEVHIGDTVAVYLRMVARSAKRMHYLMFMVNETRGALASIFECVNSFADLKVRRTAPYPPDIAAKLDALLADHTALDWDAPVSGVMGA
jgi:acyl-CoA thioester hydrolase